MTAWRPLFSIPLLMLLAACAQPPAAAPQAPPQPPGGVPAGYRLVWSDEFNQPGPPDPAKWVHDTGRNREGWHNKELQYYGGPGSSNALLRDGQLHITARQEAPRQQPDWGGQRYTSGRLITRGKAEWTYGYFEVRARMPCGGGTWPAIWLLGSGGEWPGDGEIDILEHVGHQPRLVSSAVHTTAGSGASAAHGKALLATACQALHDYQLLWTAQGLWFGVDGHWHWHYPRRAADGRDAWPFDRPQFMILNLAIGGDLGGQVDDRIFPVAMLVDHVRVYQAAP